MYVRVLNFIWDICETLINVNVDRDSSIPYTPL